MIELAKGQELALAGTDETTLTTLRFGIGWDKDPTAGAIASGRAEIDLDASAVQFAGGQLFDLAFYNNLATRDGSVVHLGDNQSGRGDADDESVTVDLRKVYGKVDTIVLLVSSYQGHALEWISNAYCRLVDTAGETEVELARFTLTLGVPQTGLAMAKIYRDTSGDGASWRLKAIGEGIAVTQPARSVEALQRFLT